MRDPSPTLDFAAPLLTAAAEVLIDWRGDRITGDRRGLEALEALHAAAADVCRAGLDADLARALDVAREIDRAGWIPERRARWEDAAAVVHWWLDHAHRWPGVRERIEAHAVWPYLQGAAWL